MTDDPGGDHDDRFGRLRRAHDDLSATTHEAIRTDPDRARGYRRAEEMRAWHQVQVGRYADLKGDVLLAASEERGVGPASLAELAGGVTRQRTTRMVKEARDRRSGPGEGETA